MAWEYDTNHSYFGFLTKHLGINTVHGHFDEVEVTINIESADPTQWSVKAVAQTASINTGIPRRDDHIRSDAYLDAANYPTTSFESKKVEPKGERYAMTGALTMHGVTRDITLEVSFNGEAPDREVLKRGFSARGSINRFDFGVGDPAKTPSVGEEIRFVFNMEAKRPMEG